MEDVKTNEVHPQTKKRNPISWVPTAYFAMGMPFVIVNMVAVLMYKDLGIDEKTITFWTGLILLPWSLKPLWSPIMELYKTKKFYVVLTQILSGACFGLIALGLHLPSFFAITIALFAVVAFSGATHDIALDGLYMHELDKDTQARYIGWQGAFYNLAKLIATGGLVWLAGKFINYLHETRGLEQHAANLSAWTYIMSIFAIILLTLGAYHLFALPLGGGHADAQRKTFSQTMAELLEVLIDFLKKNHIWYYICFIVLYRFAEGFVVKMVPLFLKETVDNGGLGLSNETIGLLYGTFGSLAFLVGSILAGYYISHFGLKKTLFSLCCVFNLPFVVYTLLAIYQPSSLYVIGGGIAIEYFGYGFGFVGLTLFMMQQIAPGKFQMSHYAFASAIMNFGVMLPGMLSGWVWEMLGGYKPFFIFVLFATIPAFLITYFVPFTYDDKK
ncbi:MAG: MFS transporter [Alloprevotella sp.]|nr:MFS transporter [Alloprevotella sp.]